MRHGYPLSAKLFIAFVFGGTFALLALVLFWL